MKEEEIFAKELDHCMIVGGVWGDGVDSVVKTPFLLPSSKEMMR